jgi:hypothetical protein
MLNKEARALLNRGGNNPFFGTDDHGPGYFHSPTRHTFSMHQKTWAKASRKWNIGEQEHRE